MKGFFTLDNIRSAEVMKCEDNFHIFVKDDELSVELVLTDELTEHLLRKLTQE